MIGRYLFPRPAGVLLESSVVATLDRYRQDAPAKPEAGGLLLGYRRGANLHVVTASEPRSTDSRSRFAFERRARGHQELADAQWRLTDGLIDYLGEWHTHPEDDPSPSAVDRAAWQTIVANRAPHRMLFVIVGRTGHFWAGVAESDGMQSIHLERGFAESDPPA